MAVFPSTRVPLVGSSLWADALPKSGGPEKAPWWWCPTAFWPRWRFLHPGFGGGVDGAQVILFQEISLAVVNPSGPLAL